MLEFLVFLPTLVAVLFAATDCGLYAFQRYQSRAEILVLLLGRQKELVTNGARSESRSLEVESQIEKQSLVLRFSVVEGRLLSIDSLSPLAQQEAGFIQKYVAKTQTQIPHILSKRRLRQLSGERQEAPFYSERSATLFSQTKQRYGLLPEFSAKFASLPEEVFVAELSTELR